MGGLSLCGWSPEEHGIDLNGGCIPERPVGGRNILKGQVSWAQGNGTSMLQAVHAQSSLLL